MKPFHAQLNSSMKLHWLLKTKTLEYSFFLSFENREEGKDQESIQSSTTPDPGNRMGKWQK